MRRFNTNRYLGRGTRREPRPSQMSIKKLEEMLQMEPDRIVVGLCSEEAGLEKLLKSELSNDCIVLVIRVISKCCKTSFQQNKAKILASICEKDFTDQLIKYLNEINLHDSQDKMGNKYFWSNNNQDLFWQDLIELYESVIRLMPNTAVEVLPKILKQTILTIKNFTNETIIIPDDIKTNLEDIQSKLLLCVEEREKKKISKVNNIQDVDPPDDFRQISLYPLIHEITDRSEKVFLRPNIIDGKYRNVEHYLDVHFRLLREDFVAPLRDGICQYLSQQLTKERKHISNVRFHEEVMFVSTYIVQDKVATVIQLKAGKNKNDLESTRRFMYGSLVCFTNNNFQSVIFGTVAAREEDLFKKNQIAIDLNNDKILSGVYYRMVECNLYFEPYYHVLKALQNMTENEFPLKRYIIDVEPEVYPPKYLQEDSIFKIDEYSFNALKKDKWPSAQDLGLDNSQHRAFQAALTKEFCVIQGPPGTGKTFIGLKITETLIENEGLWNSKFNPILVICYTNHALDQFLEGICEFTDNIVRIGGQSKNKNLEEFNIKTMRRNYDLTEDGNTLIYERRSEFKRILNNVKELQIIVNTIDRYDSILNINMFEVIDEQISNSWFAQVSNSEILEWLMAANHFKERKKQEFTQRVIQNSVIVEKQASISKDVFFNLEEEQQRQLDDSHIDAFGPHILNFLLVTEKKFQLRICDAERNLNFLVNEQDECTKYKKKKKISVDRGRAEAALNKLHEDYDNFKWSMDQLKLGKYPPRPSIIDYNNPQLLTSNERWGLYAYWLELYRNSLMIKLNKLHEEYREVYQQYEEVKQIEDINLMRSKLVIGMTTTGAARYQTMLQALKCSIVIVEEAAEVLESHVVIALTNNCQHLILIGDHKQLRPTTSEYRLRKKCNLDISLFERMVSNNIHCETLDVQHRMRPEIAKLIVPTIYPKLENHPTVYNYPPVRGVTKSLFFISHTEAEEAVDADYSSRTNIHEVKFLIKLARHFILQGYKPEDITILAAYSGQMFCFWKESKNFPLLEDVRITGVDNYQGEENKLILLSLVRSNQDSNIGFLRTDNRVNVALSRAKEGLFIMGNMSILEKSDNAWPKIKQTLEENDQIGPYLTLQCQLHKDQLTAVRTADDFQKVAEGGCSKLCESLLKCGHVCHSLCHVIDREHIEYNCTEPCTIGLCEIGHPCPLECYVRCRPCEVPLPVTLKCDHTHNLPCHMGEEDIFDYPCPTLVDTKLKCDHVVAKPCHCNSITFSCPQPCDVRMLCGHTCELSCHIRYDPDHLKFKCKKQCTRPSRGCSQTEDPHLCRRVCYEDCMECDVVVQKTREPCGHIWKVSCSQSVDDMKCTKRCKNKLDCGHNCRLECWETCGKCGIKVDKIIESCGHKIKTKCSQVPDRKMCGGQCPRPLPCGHPCNKKCNEPCKTSCTALIDSLFMGACGHRFQIPCSYSKENQDLGAESFDLLKYCREPCKEVLQCGHVCGGTCGECAQGRIHATCKEKCGATLICGHECKTSCSEMCQPCDKKCYYKCSHSKCGKKCGEPCAECKEPCIRKCIHGQCSRLCSEPCNIPPCNEPCTKLLRCKHPCIGFCGEPCPPLCRICNADHETFSICFGAEDEPNARFIYLVECQHIIEAGAMDTWMQQNMQADEVINVKCCPKCKTITMIQRYSEYIKQVFKDIIAIKKKVYLEDDDENTARRARLQMDLASLQQDNLSLYKGSKYLETLIKEILFVLKETHDGKRNPLNKLSLEACTIKFKLIQNMINILNQGHLENYPIIYGKCLDQIDLILSHLVLNESRISDQKIKDIDLEMSRFQKLIHLFTIEKNLNFSCTSIKPEIKTLYSCIDKKLNTVAKYSLDLDTDEDLMAKLEDLRLLVDETISIIEVEKQMIVKAIGLGKGRWFKCPQGHYYAIGECGGAMEVGKCNECGSAIGGKDHALLETNQFAGEMDGAAHPAWSNITNLNNYQLH